jgi:hypothetical protein
LRVRKKPTKANPAVRQKPRKANESQEKPRFRDFHAALAAVARRRPFRAESRVCALRL